MIEEKDKDFSIYEVPLSLVDNKLDELIVDQLGLKTAEPRSGRLARAAAPAAQSGARNQHRRRRQVCRASRRLQVDLRSARPRRHRPSGPGPHQPHSKRGRSKREGPERLLAGYDGILVPGGFGERGIEGKVEAIRFARERGIPFFGICLGMQCAVIEFARNVVRPGRRPLDRVRQGHAAPGDLPARRAEDDHRQGRHDAARRPADAPRTGQRWPPVATARPKSPSGIATATSSTTSTASNSPPTACDSPAPAPTARWSRSSNCPSIPGSWPCSFIRSSSRSRRPRSRCSAGFIGAAVARSQKKTDRPAAKENPAADQCREVAAGRKTDRL